MFKREIASVYERDALVRLRESPTLDYTIPTPGYSNDQVNYDLQRWRERRIHYLNTRLAVASHVLRREFDRER